MIGKWYGIQSFCVALSILDNFDFGLFIWERSDQSVEKNSGLIFDYNHLDFHGFKLFLMPFIHSVSTCYKTVNSDLNKQNIIDNDCNI